MLLTITFLLPLVVALLLLWPRGRASLTRMAPWTGVPAFLVALFGEPGTSITLDWLLLGARVVLDETERVFLLFSSVLWTAAAVYARAYLARDPRQHRFLSFFLLTMAGNLGLIVAGDMLTFYVCFAVMSFASYPLVVHAGDAGALQAGRVYIALVIVGELLLFTGIMAAASIAGRVDLAGAPAVVAASGGGPVVMALLAAGFGIKVGALPLHVWLPLAHPAAPTPASAVLSGALIKAGLMGWLRFLPLGDVALPAIGLCAIVAGLVAAFGAAFVGLTQTNPKSALAYSSISQMGFLTVGVGAGLVAPDAWPLLLPALLLYALHHGLAKGALFLAAGVATAAAGASRRTRGLVLAGTLVPALSLAGVPLTSGAASKVALKSAIDGAGEAMAAWPWLGGIDGWLTLAAAGTTLLMARVLWLLAGTPAASHGQLTAGLVLPWAVLVGVVSLIVWVPGAGFQDAALRSLAPAYLWPTLWPPLLGAAMAAFAWRHPATGRWRRRLHVPAGDLLWPALVAWQFTVRLAAAVPARAAIARGIAVARSFPWGRLSRPAGATRWEHALTRWNAAGALLLAITLALIVLLAGP